MQLVQTHQLGSLSLLCVAVLSLGLSAAACKEKKCPPGQTEYSGHCLTMTSSQIAAGSESAGSGGESGSTGTAATSGGDASTAGTDAGEPGSEADASAADGGGGSGGEGGESGQGGESAMAGAAAGASGAGGEGAPGEVPPACFPSAEYCDSKDNDCDGRVDETLTRPCGPPSRGQCKSGTETCTNGAWSTCTGATEGSAEICDAERNDENCDGSANEGCACSAGEQKACARSEGICIPGQQYCTDGTWGSCEGASEMTMEVCDAANRDEDCDGMINEGCECTPGQTDRCDTGRQGACKSGIKMCAGGKWADCVTTVAPAVEVCEGEGADEDCDGMVDEGCCRDGEEQDCTTDREGVCGGGRQRCSGGEWSACESEVQASAERCDGEDNDCNGMVDDGEPCPNGQRCVDGRRCVGCTRASEATDCPNDNPCERSRCNDQGACVADRRPDGTACETEDGAGMCAGGTCMPEVQANEDDIVCYLHAGDGRRSEPTTAITFRQAPLGLTACMPNRGPEGCNDWFECETRNSRVGVEWELYGDGRTEVLQNVRSIAHAAAMEAFGSENQPEPRKWFGAPRTDDGRAVECRLFDDPNRPMGAYREFYVSSPGRICVNERTCASSFGLCEVVE